MASIRDVAARAKVSISTVSAVLNGHKFVSDALRERVTKAVEELDYRPNFHARAMFTGKTNSLAVLVPTIADPFFSMILDEVEEIAYKNGYSLLICNTRGTIERVEFYKERLSDINVDGLFVSLISEIVEGSDIMEHFKQRGIPMVGFGGLRVRPDIDCIVTEDMDGAMNACKYLIGLNHKQIAYVGPQSSMSGRQKLAGVRKALEESGIGYDESLVALTKGYMRNSGQEAVLQLLARSTNFTAVVCFDDLFAVGVAESLQSHGFRIPEDVSIIGFDNTVSQFSEPKLTTMAVDTRQIAQEAAERLLRRMANPELSYPPQIVAVRHEIVVRESTMRLH